MKLGDKVFTPKQLLFQELFVGTLIYVVVLGFFNDYTSVVYAQSFSTIFFASVVLEVLTYLALKLKSGIVNWLKPRRSLAYRSLMFFCAWLVMFLSKFVFVWAIDLIFGSYITIEGFFGILFVVVTVTAVQRLAYFTFKELGRVATVEDKIVDRKTQLSVKDSIKTLWRIGISKAVHELRRFYIADNRYVSKVPSRLAH